MNLLLSLKSLLPRATDNSVFVMIDELLNIFSDYDEQKLEAKKLPWEKQSPFGLN